MAERSPPSPPINSDAGVSNPNDDRKTIAPETVVSVPDRSKEPDEIQKKERSLTIPPRRRSNRDINAIRLAGVGKTAHTFYRRMRTLFFSNPTGEEYRTLLSNGSRRRKKNNEKSASSTSFDPSVLNTDIASDRVEHAVVATTVAADTTHDTQCQNAIQVERATGPDEAAIYVIDNFLTELELEYFDSKIASISFERSFVDNMDDENDDDENDDNDNDKNIAETKNAQHSLVDKDQSRNGGRDQSPIHEIPRDIDDDGSKRFPLGTKTFKVFGEGCDRAEYQGKVIAYDEDAKLYKILYEDGDEEEMHHNELRNHGTSRMNDEGVFKHRLNTNVCKENPLTSTSPGEAIDAKKRQKKRGQNTKKRKRKTIIYDSHRTSSFYSFRKLHDNKISALEQRIANIFGCWVHQIEALQLVRYLPGQFFGIHHDLGNLLEDDTVQLPRKSFACKRRLVTIFCYLNTLPEDQGGCTYFPKCGHLRVRPKRGRAVLWCNITSDGKADARTIHAGEAVKVNLPEVTPTISCAIKSKDSSEFQPSEIGKTSIQSESKDYFETKKYGLNIWICEE